MTRSTFAGWPRPPRIGVLVPPESDAGWRDAALWCAWLEAWGFPAERVPARAIPPDITTLVVPAAVLDGSLVTQLRAMASTTVLVVGTTGSIPELPAARAFPHGASALDRTTTERIVDQASDALADAAPAGLVGIWRWPNAGTATLVVDGDVDHPTGVDPECSRYVAPAIETMRRAGYPAYGIFASAANVEAEPSSFPRDVDYYNHSFSHPYSYWNPASWESLDDDAIADEIERSNATFRACLGSDDHGIFRLPHFQLEAADRTYAVLDRLGYRGESSIGGNVSLTAGLPFHPAIRAWTDRTEDAAYARSHPDPSGRRAILQLPISTDPTDPDFLNGCCSYNTLGEGVRERAADPGAYEEVLHQVLTTAIERRGLAHLFIDPPDAGYGRLPGDRADYAGAVERWLSSAVPLEELRIMTTARLTTWWLARERAVAGLRWEIERGDLVVDLPDAPPGTTLTIVTPDGDRILEEAT